MQIELRKVKLNKKLSEETPCFSADVHVAGEKVAEVANRGRGGPNEYRYVGTTTLTNAGAARRELVDAAREWERTRDVNAVGSTCLCCKGTGKQVVTCEGGHAAGTGPIPCVWCSGAGVVTPSDEPEVIDSAVMAALDEYEYRQEAKRNARKGLPITLVLHRHRDALGWMETFTIGLARESQIAPIVAKYDAYRRVEV